MSLAKACAPRPVHSVRAGREEIGAWGGRHRPSARAVPHPGAEQISLDQPPRGYPLGGIRVFGSRSGPPALNPNIMTGLRLS